MNGGEYRGYPTQAEAGGSMAATGRAAPDAPPPPPPAPANPAPEEMQKFDIIRATQYGVFTG